MLLENQHAKKHPVYIHVQSSPQSLSMSFGGIGYGTRRGLRGDGDDGAVTGFKVMRPVTNGDGDNDQHHHHDDGQGKLSCVDEMNQSTHRIDVGDGNDVGGEKRGGR